MTKSEMHLHDTAFIGPALLFLDQYFNSFIDEYIVLWIALVSTGSLCLCVIIARVCVLLHKPCLCQWAQLTHLDLMGLGTYLNI